MTDKKSHHPDIFPKLGQVSYHAEAYFIGFYEQGPKQNLCSEVLPACDSFQSLTIKALNVFTIFSGNI
jgi:hypothetical protein